MARSSFGGFTTNSGSAGSRVNLSIKVDGSNQSDLGLAFEGRLQEEIDAAAARIGQAYVKAMKLYVERNKKRLRDDIAGGGFYRGERLAKSWRGLTYPKGGAGSLSPAGWFTTKARTIIEVFETSTTIRVENRQFLAIPLGPAKAIVRRMNSEIARNKGGASTGRNAFGRFVTLESPVHRVEQALGVKLVPIVNRETENGVLVAESGLRLTPTGRGAKRQGGAATPLFALVKQATLKKRIRGEALLKDIETGFPAGFQRALATTLEDHDK